MTKINENHYVLYVFYRSFSGCKYGLECFIFKVPCGHSLCKVCAFQLVANECPFCRLKIDLKIPNWEIVKYLPKPIIPPEFELIKDKIENFKSTLNHLSKINFAYHHDVKLKMEQLNIYEHDTSEHLKESTEIVENLRKTINKYENIIDQAENKFFPENLLKIKSKISFLFEFLTERAKSLESEHNYLNMYKTLNFPLIFNCHKDDSIRQLFIFDNSNAEIIYYNIISICNVSEKKFYDYYFPANEKSLFLNINSQQAKQKIKWLRPESVRYDYSGDEEMTIYHDPSESELRHGFLGNYWLLSGIFLE